MTTTIMAFPIRGDSYTECLYPALAAQGADVREGIFAGRWLLRHLRGVDYIHINWPYFFYGTPQRVGALRGFLRFLFLLSLARWRGARIAWTVHNLYPHDPCVIPPLNPLARWIMVRAATHFFIHGPGARAEALRTFPLMAGRVTLIEHGNWIEYYPNATNRSDARTELALNGDAYVFLFVGLCKPYKNLDGLLAAFARLPHNAVLVIAGMFPDPSYHAHVLNTIECSPARPRIRLIPEFQPREKLQILLNAADVVVAPYVEVLTSGTAMLALSFGCPFIGPACGFLSDVVTSECGILYDRNEPDGLRRAMQQAMSLRFDRHRIIAVASRHDWRRSARVMLDAFTRHSRTDTSRSTAL